MRALLAVAETAAQDDLAQLTSVYESMKPADASAIFAEMDPNLAAGFLGMMQPESAGRRDGGSRAERGLRDQRAACRAARRCPNRVIAALVTIN